MPANLSDKTVGRLSLYRRLLNSLAKAQGNYLFSHDLAAAAGVTAAQVRRDVMAVGYAGSPIKGYDVAELAECIGKFIDGQERQAVSLVGVGNLGRAILAYFTGRRPNLNIVAAFDRDPHRVNRVIHGCRCYPAEMLEETITAQAIRTAIIAVPASEAQPVATRLVRSGIRGILNFAPTPLRVAPNVYVEEMDLTASLEKVAFFARQQSQT